MMFGTGMAGLYYTLKNNAPVQFKPMGMSFWISFGGLMFCVIFTLIGYQEFKFNTNHMMGTALILGYFLIMLPSILVT
jgi:hypothetical protein